MPGRGIARKQPGPRPGALLAVIAALAAACTSADDGGVGPSTTEATTTTTAPAPTTTTLPGPGGPYAPEPGPPAGPAPSFNESPGCGAAQGIRGPYATVAGDLADSEAVRGPWGDFYGRDFGEVRSHLVEVALPMTGGREVTVWVHEAVLPALEAAIANLEREEAAGNYYEIRAGDVSSFRPATVTPKRYLSFHAMGAAIDINTSTNPYSGDNELVTDMPPWFVKAWTDAGWCWGGDWQTIKDPMHFSWKGPLYTAGYAAAGPSAPRTSAAWFRRSVTFPTVLGPSPDDTRLFLVDADRDGAADLLRAHPWTAAGNLGVEIAQALYEFRAGCTPLVTAPVAEGAALVMADGDGDARPDLWEIGESEGRAQVTIHTHASGFSQHLRPRRSGAGWDPGASFLAGDYDRDGWGDLFVVRPALSTLEVWAGPGFDRLLARAGLPTGLGAGNAWRFALGDHDVDGVLDLFALSPDVTARLLVFSGGPGFTAAPEEIGTGAARHDGAFAVSDLDGDGRPDLYFLDTDGTMTVYLGGGRGVDADLTYWFVEGDDQPTTRQEACPVVPQQPGGALSAAAAW